MKKTAAISLKKKVYACCKKQLEEKIQMQQLALNELKTGAENDAKSSAGDKHETARAMMQMEHEKISKHLDETIRQKNDLDKIDIGNDSLKIINGSLIKTNSSYFFLSIALGKINADGISVMAISSQSPLGQKMGGLIAGDSLDINGFHYIIEDVK